jgi:hypothetical protein
MLGCVLDGRGGRERRGGSITVLRVGLQVEVEDWGGDTANLAYGCAGKELYWRRNDALQKCSSNYEEW